VSSDILTCRCRFCGKSFPYLRQDAGATAECPECHNSVLLPGKLQGVATKRRGRVNSPPGLAMEVGGALLLFFWFPIGAAFGVVLISLGWRKNSVLRCSNCEGVTSKEAARCAKCGAAFSSE
jgi:hypothetical protein